jgi:hypothetical protein
MPTADDRAAFMAAQASADRAVFERVNRLVSLHPKGDDCLMRPSPAEQPGTARADSDGIILSLDVFEALQRHERREALADDLAKVGYGSLN